jgi:prepilin-type processing-associated H-X9-DG protein
LCAFVGLFTCGVGAFVGLILGVIALRRAAGHVAAGGRRWPAVVGIGASVISIIVSILLILAGRWLYLAEMENSSSKILRDMAVSTVQEAQDHGGRLPAVEAWDRELIAAGHTTEYSLHDPIEGGEGRSYAMNRFLSGKKLGDVHSPARTVLFFECVCGTPPAAGPESLPAHPRHPHGYLVAFCDGHVRSVPEGRLGDLVWELGGQGELDQRH